MKVLHVGREVAGNMNRICQYVRERLGVDVLSINYYTSGALDYKCDINLSLDKLQPREAYTKRLGLLIDLAIKYDIICFHFMETFLPDMSDLALLKDRGKKIIFFCWGSDVRAPELIYWYQMKYQGLNVDRPYTWTRDRYQRIALADRYADIIYGFEGLPRRVPFFGLINTEDLTIPYIPESKTLNRPFKIIHAVRPDAKAIKGTPYILSAIQAVITKPGNNIIFEVISGLSPEKARLKYIEADLIIDQIGGGYMGSFAYEGLHFGKPVITYQHPDYDAMFGRSPMLYVTSPEELIKAIYDAYSIWDSKAYRNLSYMGKEWVRKNRCITQQGADHLLHLKQLMDGERIRHEINIEWRDDEEKMGAGIKSRFYKEAIEANWPFSSPNYDKELYA